MPEIVVHPQQGPVEDNLPTFIAGTGTVEGRKINFRFN